MISKRKKKKIAYISGTRADFGLMVPVLEAISNNPDLNLQIYVTGIHLMKKFGYTVNQVQKKFPLAMIIDSFFGADDRKSVPLFMADFVKKLTNIFEKNRPDFVLTLGDRPEMVAVSIVCVYLGIPSGHLHGGEKTSTVDEFARHAITKLSHIHFPATKESAKRIKKMGEEEWRIHVVGAPALDNILGCKLPTKEELYRKINLDLKKKFILVTQHPVSGEIEDAANQMRETIKAVKKFKMPVVVVYPHADPGGLKMIKIIDKEKRNPLFRIIPSLEHEYFLALEREAAVWVGNSSGALIESSSFKIPVVNIGTRQLGRQRGLNVMNSDYDSKEIESAIRKSLFDPSYQKSLSALQNPWGDGKTGERIANIIANLEINPYLINKQICY